MLVLAAGGEAAPAIAQQDDVDEPVSQAVVQPVPNSDAINLNAALTRLGHNPRDVDALIDAGNAGLAIGDVDAAIGFFNRADQVAPGNPRVKAGLASALVRSGDPFNALPLFDQAERAGALGGKFALDRGLAYDLVGDNAAAQRYYRQTLAAGANDEASRRLALSLAIAGDKRASAAALSPLLTRQDKAAWRARAFALAILGQTDDAVAIANASLPASLAASLAAYLRYMPRLTPAQQAAAANLGRFPRASEIGHDDPRLAAYAPSSPSRRPGIAAADSALIPRGKPLGPDAHTRGNRDSSRESGNNSGRQHQRDVARAEAHASRQARESRIAPPDPQPGREAVPAPLLSSAGPASSFATGPAAVPGPAPLPAAALPSVVLAPRAPVAPPRPLSPRSGAAIAGAGAVAVRQSSGSAAVNRIAPVPAAPAAPGVTPPAAAPVHAPAPPATAARDAPASSSAPPPPRPSLAEAFSDLGRPAVDVSPAAGAVDIRRIRPARATGDGTATGSTTAAVKPPPPSHPSRIWVQVATGRDKAALAYDWHRMSRQADAAFKGKRPNVSVWGQSNRLLVGPFESEASAEAFLAQLRRAEIEGAFLWTSPAGQVVDAMPGR